MKLIAQILPYVKKALRQNNNDNEAKELIRQIEMNAFTSTSANTIYEDTQSTNTAESQNIQK